MNLRSGGLAVANSVLGYDMIYAVTAATLNAEFALLYAQGGVFKRELSISYIPSEPTPKMDATLGAPELVLTPETTANQSVLLRIPVISGTLFFKDASGEVQELPVDGASIGMSMKLETVDIATLLASHALSGELRGRVEALQSTPDFSIQGLFAVLTQDLSNINDSVVPPDITNDRYALQAFNSIVFALMETYKGADNPFLLGVNLEKTDGATLTASGAPTSLHLTEYTGSADTGLNTINYCMMVDHHEAPLNGGLFTAPPVPTIEQQGTYLIANDVIVNDLIHSIGAALGASDLRGKFTAEPGGKWVSSEFDFDGGKLQIAISPEPEKASLRVDYTFKDSDSRSLGPVSAKVSQTSRRTDSYTFKVEDIAPKEGLPKQPMLTVESHNGKFDEDDPHISHSPDWLPIPKKLEEWIATLLEALQNLLNGISDKLDIGVEIHLLPNLSMDLPDGDDLVSQVPFLMPTGQTLYFRHLTMTPAGHLQLATSYRN